MSPLGFVRNNALKLSYRGAKDKENKLLAFLGKKKIYIFFFLVRVVLSTKLLIFSLFLLRISFSPQVFPNSLLRTKRQTDFRLFSRHYIQKANALIMMAGFPGFYQMLSFTRNQLGIPCLTLTLWKSTIQTLFCSLNHRAGEEDLAVGENPCLWEWKENWMIKKKKKC